MKLGLQIIDGRHQAVAEIAGFKFIPQAKPGKVFISNADGEGMEVDEAKLAPVLTQFFNREF